MVCSRGRPASACLRNPPQCAPNSTRFQRSSIYPSTPGLSFLSAACVWIGEKQAEPQGFACCRGREARRGASIPPGPSFLSVWPRTRRLWVLPSPQANCMPPYERKPFPGRAGKPKSPEPPRRGCHGKDKKGGSCSQTPAFPGLARGAQPAWRRGAPAPPRGRLGIQPWAGLRRGCGEETLAKEARRRGTRAGSQKRP